MVSKPSSNRNVDYSPLIEQLLAPWDVWEAQPGRFRARCGFHKGDNLTSFSIFKNGRYRCFKCGVSGDMPRLLSFVRKLTLAQARDALGSAVLPVLKDFQALPKPPTLKELKEARGKPKYATLPESTLGPYRRNCPNYLVNRGFSANALKEWEIGYDLQRYKIVLPVRDWRGKLVGLTYRLDFAADKHQPAKYWHDNFLKSLHLYGFHKYARKPVRRLFLVEGQLDAVRLWQLNLCAVAVMGSDLSVDQADLIIQQCHADQIVLAFDNDEAGEKVRKQAQSRLSRTAFGPKLAVLKYPTKDPGELDETHKLSLIPWWKFLACN